MITAIIMGLWVLAALAFVINDFTAWRKQEQAVSDLSASLKEAVTKCESLAKNLESLAEALNEKYSEGE